MKTDEWREYEVYRDVVKKESIIVKGRCPDEARAIANSEPSYAWAEHEEPTERSDVVDGSVSVREVEN